MTTTTIITDTVDRLVGDREKITRAEMCDLLRTLSEAGVDLRNGYVNDTYAGGSYGDLESPTAAQAWTTACQGLTVISVGPGLRDGAVRYDEPGSMHPMQHSELMFVAEALGDYEYDQIGQMRKHCDRLLVVTGPHKEPAAEPTAPETYECDNGHRWHANTACPICGEWWV